MDRRAFIESCSAAATCLSAAAALPVFAADARPRAYARAVLTDEFGDPLKASSLKARANYVFHYPYVATPVFLLNLDTPVPPAQLTTEARESYVWPGGVGARRNVVAFSAICAHQLVYPTPQVSFISFRRNRAQKGVQDNLIHCCAEHSQYDPAKGAQVLDGPAPQPLCAVLLEHDPRADTLTAYATLGGELFDAFFRKYEMKLSLDVGPTARHPVAGRAPVRELEKFCKNPIQC
ncbi:MAG: Rieske 2Fe-2S domain-containing protein [Burkholderiaceae bacterium]|jgi:Rieske Fe-S protein|nr:Rieske 2Fe-2S domain-containing protein [Burkholderiaceae bacterium]MDZ4145649.1 Rieske 2Fe-2S domain-containing protein [Burkholderiales bacterium]PKO43459.1 MAG: (2Fe-2S)-binding protein [Betaproteobacteria bacterium HGW-Betaproteobacteria-3]